MTLDFPYHDRALLRAGERNGGRVWVPELARRRGGLMPVVVVLHGIEKRQQNHVHRLLDRSVDLRQLVGAAVRDGRIAPVLLAAPSQTTRARGATTLWTPQGFDLQEFLRVVDRQLALHTNVRIHRRRVAVFAHSGAGCYFGPSGGNGVYHVIRQIPALWRAGIHIKWIGLMDTCFLGAYGANWLRVKLHGTGIRVAAMWTDPVAWGRPDYRQVTPFIAALRARPTDRCDETRYNKCFADERGWIAFHARSRALLHAFSTETRSGSRSGPSPHYALPLWFAEEVLRRWLPARPPTVTESLDLIGS